MSKDEIFTILTNKGSSYCNEKVFKKHFKEIYDDIMLWTFPDGFPFKQKLYHYFHNDKELMLGLCKECGKRCVYKNINDGYYSYCSCKCKAKNKNEQSKARKTCIERYGVTHPSKARGIREKAKETCLKRYGVEYATQNPDIADKIKQTKLERYGDENYNNMEKYRQTCMERYGSEHYAGTDDMIRKSSQTFLERYGVKNAFLCKEIQNKSRSTRIEKYGTEWAIQNPDIADKIKQTKLERYGDENYNNQPKHKQTCIERYGVEHILQRNEFIEQVRKTNLERFGVEWACMRPESKNYHTISKINIAFAEQMSSNGIEYDMEFPIGSYNYDFKVGNTLIEINPTITHNSFTSIFGREPTQPDYHLAKSKVALTNGYTCIHIWDWDDTCKIINTLKPKKQICSGALDIREVDKNECDEFVNNYHFQNTCDGQSVRLGLYKDNILVELMSFGTLYYDNGYDYELFRICSHPDYIITNGEERLFKHFIEHYNPQSIIAYCDASKYDGNTYTRLGFELLEISEPSKHWYRQKSKEHTISNNDKLMLEHGFLPVYDCGQLSFIWKRN